MQFNKKSSLTLVDIIVCLVAHIIFARAVMTKLSLVNFRVFFVIGSSLRLTANKTKN